MSKAVEPIQAALDDAIKAQQGLQLEVAQLSLKIEDEKEKHKNHVEEVSAWPLVVHACMRVCVGS